MAGGGPVRPFGGRSREANFLRVESVADELVTVAPFIPPGRGTTLDLLTSLKPGPMRPCSRHQRVGLAFRVLLIACRCGPWSGPTPWDFIGGMNELCARRDRVRHRAGLHAANRIGCAKNPLLGRRGNGLRPERRSSSTDTTEARPHPTGQAGLFATGHCWPALATFPGRRTPRFSLDLLTQRGLDQVER